MIGIILMFLKREYLGAIFKEPDREETFQFGVFECKAKLVEKVGRNYHGYIVMISTLAMDKVGFAPTILAHTCDGAGYRDVGMGRVENTG